MMEPLSGYQTGVSILCACLRLRRNTEAKLGTKSEARCENKMFCQSKLRIPVWVLRNSESSALSYTSVNHPLLAEEACNCWRPATRPESASVAPLSAREPSKLQDLTHSPPVSKEYQSISCICINNWMSVITFIKPGDGKPRAGGAQEWCRLEDDFFLINLVLPSAPSPAAAGFTEATSAGAEHFRLVSGLWSMWARGSSGHLGKNRYLARSHKKLLCSFPSGLHLHREAHVVKQEAGDVINKVILSVQRWLYLKCARVHLIYLCIYLLSQNGQGVCSDAGKPKDVFFCCIKSTEDE